MNPENTTSRYTYDDEIDLLDILSKFIKIIRKHIFLLLVLGVIGGLIGILFALLESPTYASKMTLESRVVGYAEVATLIETLQELVDEDNTKELARKLEVEEKIAASIKSIEAINILQEEMENPEKDYVESEKVTIEIQIEDNQYLSLLEKKIIRYMENNPYIKSRIKVEVEHLKLEIQNLTREIKQLDSLKRSVKLLVDNPGDKNVYLPDLGNLFGQSKQLYKDKLDLEYELKFAEKFQLLAGFTLFSEPIGLGKLAYGSIGGAIAFVLWCLVVVFLELRALIQPRIQ